MPQGEWTAFDCNNMLHIMWNYFTSLNLKWNTIILCSFESVTQFTVVSHNKYNCQNASTSIFLAQNKPVNLPICWELFWNILVPKKRDCCYLECMDVAQLLGDALHWNEMHCLAVADGTAKHVWLSSIIWWRWKLCITFGKALNITYYRWHRHTEY